MREKLMEKAQKCSDYVFEGETLYRQIPHRAGNKDVVARKLCVPQELREAVLQEKHDSPAAGHVEGLKAIARLAARYYWPGMQRDARAYERKCEDCLKFKPKQRQDAGKNADTILVRAMGNSVRRLCRTAAEIEAWQTGAVGSDRSFFKMDRVTYSDGRNPLEGILRTHNRKIRRTESYNHAQWAAVHQSSIQKVPRRYGN